MHVVTHLIRSVVRAWNGSAHSWIYQSWTDYRYMHTSRSSNIHAHLLYLPCLHV